ncbi:hypothetical protein F53441_4383 [Fusarium austroafricanum]|uniref:FAD-binding domain-containing protein n=1 Tax=Fusarium austroafricanum TaxID=2364996 RepID=A0A8H4KNW7_9HYPO|nr:hypothetical protein F53441_4383 [Fusarium austroafricanum]
MSHERHFKVVIVGASVAGLSLANMLQANGINYVVLEAYPIVAPQVGASIGMLPHGNRILDQLGLYGKVMEIAPPVKVFNFRNMTGSTLAQHQEMDQRLIERHGYPMVFLDRQMLIKILYDNIEDKSKILTNKRVVQVKLIDSGFEAITSDRTSITGDILVGADGVHSTVRSEMWHLAESLSPGRFDPYEHEAPPCDYSCIFGISEPCPGINTGDLHCVFRDSSSYLVVGGPEGRVYWFRFQQLPKRLQGSGIPRYTNSDLEKALSESADDNILPDLKFSRLWSFDRIITLGDSAHKFHPVGGQGGNAAMESVALLTNNLVKALGQSTSGHLSPSQVEAIFADVQSRRKSRLAFNHRYSNSRAHTEALDTPLKRFVALQLIPLVDEQVVTLSYCSQHPGGEMLDMIPVPLHKNLIPYKQELLGEPRSRGCIQWILVAVYGILLVVASFARRNASNQSSSNVSSTLDLYQIFDTLVRGHLIFQNQLSFDYTLDWLSDLPLSQLYAFGQFVQPIAIIIIEGYRGRNRLTPLGLPILWLILIQYAGLGVAMPLYFLVYTLVSDLEFYWWPLRRLVPLLDASTLIVATSFGEPIRIALVFNSLTNATIPEAFQRARWISFLIVPVIAYGFRLLIKRNYPLTGTKSGLDLETHGLMKIFLRFATCGAFGHWFGIVGFLKDFDTLSIPSQLSSIGLQTLLNAFCQTIQAILEDGFWVYCLASYIWTVQAIWDLQRVGRARARAFNAAFGVLLSFIAFGPGASLSGVWFMREYAMFRTNFHEEEEEVHYEMMS